MSDKNTLLQEEAASAQRNLISVGGCVDTPVDLTTAGHSDGLSCFCNMKVQYQMFVDTVGSKKVTV